jgi:hypothetical protein
MSEVGKKLLVIQWCNSFVADHEAVSAANEFSKIKAAVQQATADDDRVATIT